MSSEILDNRGTGVARWSWPPVHPEGRKFGIASGVVALGFLLLGWPVIAWPFAILTACILAFFRDPARVVPQDPRAIVAPADGLITLIMKVPPPAELCGPDASGGAGMDPAPVTRVSIFMSVFDVHINRAPSTGRISRVVYIPGKFLNADLDKASEDNERQHFLLERPDGVKIGFTQIAGLVARRIVPFVRAGDPVTVGQRVGLIRFGSRVDVYLPEGTEPKVLMGQKIIAGETVLGLIGEAPMLEGRAQ